MKRAVVVLFALLFLCSLFAQATPESSGSELIVFAASSLTETLTEIKARYESLNPEVHIICNFDSSGTLKTQIENGARCDIFLSAATKQMDALDSLGLVDTSTIVNLLSNAVVLAVPAGNPKAISGFDHMAQLLREKDVFLAIGNSDVPVGQYTKRIFDYYGIEESAVAKCLSYGSNVKEVTTQVRAGSVDCGIVYATDAYSANLAVVDRATSEMCGSVVYPMAATVDGAKSDAVKAFLKYLEGEEAMAVFESVGFARAI